MPVYIVFVPTPETTTNCLQRFIMPYCHCWLVVQPEQGEAHAFMLNHRRNDGRHSKTDIFLRHPHNGINPQWYLIPHVSALAVDAYVADKRYIYDVDMQFGRWRLLVELLWTCELRPRMVEPGDIPSTPSMMIVDILRNACHMDVEDTVHPGELENNLIDKGWIVSISCPF